MQSFFTSIVQNITEAFGVLSVQDILYKMVADESYLQFEENMEES